MPCYNKSLFCVFQVAFCLVQVVAAALKSFFKTSDKQQCPVCTKWYRDGVCKDVRVASICYRNMYVGKIRSEFRSGI